MWFVDTHAISDCHPNRNSNSNSKSECNADTNTFPDSYPKRLAADIHPIPKPDSIRNSDSTSSGLFFLFAWWHHRLCRYYNAGSLRLGHAKQ